MARKYGLDPQIIRRQMMQESGGSQNAISPKGAIGLMQLMPQTAKDLGVDPTDPQQNLEGGMRLMGDLVKKYGGDYSKALAAYNAGPGPVDRAGGVPNIPETKGYVKAIMGTDNPPTDRTAQLLAADQPPQFEATAAKPPPEPTKPQFDPTTARPIADSNPAAETQSWWRMLNTSALSTPIPFTGTSVQGFFDTGNDNLKQIIQNEKDSGHPVRAALAEGYYQVQKAATDLLEGVTTPTSVALAVASGGESMAAKTLQTASSLYFGYRGSEQLVNGRLPDESTSDMIHRKIMAGTQLAASGAAGTTGAVELKEASRAYLQNALGLAGSLSNRVQAKVEEVMGLNKAAAAKQGVIEKAVTGAQTKVALQADAKITAIEAEAKSQIDALQSPTAAQIKAINDSKDAQIQAVHAIAQTTQASTAADIPATLNQLKTQATQVITQENANFKAQYAALEAKATAPVTTVNDIKAEVVNSIKEEGVQDGEIAKIKNKIFASLPGEQTTEVRQPTAAEQEASMQAGQFRKRGMTPEGIQSALANLGYVPQQIRTAMAMTFPDTPLNTTDVSYNMTRRLKTDLWEASQATKDVDVQRGLLAAMDNVDGIRSRYAEKMGFGPEAGKVDAAYMKFRRELGSGPMSDFLYAKEFSDQNSILAQAQHLMSPATGEGLRGLFDLAGIDTSPLKAALENKDTFADLPHEALPDIQKYAAAQTKQIESQYNSAVKEIGKKSDAQIKELGGNRDTILKALADKRDQAIANLGKQLQEATTTIGENKAIIPGGNDLNLSGKTSLQIRIEALKAISDNAKAAGITNPNNFTQILYGTAQLGFGSFFGLFHLGRAFAPKGIANMLASESFQNYVAQEAGVTPEMMPKFRKAIAKSAPYLEKMALSTAVAAGADQTANQGSKTISILPGINPQAPAPAPTKTATNNIAIAP